MRVDVAKLRGKLAERGVTQEQVANSIKIDKSTFSRKMKSRALDFSIGEMHEISNVLKLSSEDAKEIFLADDSQ